MSILYSFIGIIGIISLVTIGIEVLRWYFLFGVIIPYAALIAFIAGFIYRVLKWARSPVPFHIPTVCGQGKSLPWIKANNIDSPSSGTGLIKRMALEVLLFRSLFWNERVELKRAHQLLYRRNLYLWLGGLAFHWSLFIILFRHLRFFLEPVPSVVLVVRFLDGIFQSIVPVIYTSDVIIAAALIYLFLRRVTDPRIRYLSLPSDYVAILLLLSVVFSGILMRLFYRVDLVKVKEWAMGMLNFHPALPEGVGLLFYIHLFFAALLIAYFPLSKLMHMAGIFLSPTMNLKNDSRMRRHVNPWDYPVKVHTYEQWEGEFREAMKEVGLPVEKE
jgi:nitrate reductase gamma subunit